MRAARELVLGLAGLILFAALGCGGSASMVPEEPALRVLFVGNSLTAANDLPQVVSSLAARTGTGRIEVASVAPGGVSLEEHWASTGARERIEAGGWDAVVLQQGPSSLPPSQAHLQRWAVRWADLARSLGVRPALMTVWPETARASSFPEVVRSYAEAAAASGALLLPAGAAWREALARDPELPLYGADGLHPSELGTSLAALVVYAGLTETAIGSLPASLDLPGAAGTSSPTAVRVLREAAAGALAAPAG
jgi:lysophospholipase L1-like esterase